MSRASVRRGCIWALLASLTTAGCTIRYSQTLAGEIWRVEPRSIQNSDSGVDVFGIAFSEPTSSDELLSLPCEAGLVEVDYRGIFYYFVSIPTVRTVSYCVVQSSTQPSSTHQP